MQAREEQTILSMVVIQRLHADRLLPARAQSQEEGVCIYKVTTRRRPDLKAHHLLLFLDGVIAVYSVPHIVSTGSGQSMHPLPHQGPDASDPVQSRRGPDLPLPQHSNAWHGPAMSSHQLRTGRFKSPSDQEKSTHLASLLYVFSVTPLKYILQEME